MLCQSGFTALSPFPDRSQIYQFLARCQQQALEKNHAQIASIPLTLQQIDPLVVLDKFAQPHQLHFYWEHRDSKLAIAALDAVLSLKLTGCHRFAQAQQWMEQWQPHLLPHSSFTQPWTIARFFCSFTFFDQVAAQAPFAPATVFLPRWQIIRWQNQSAAVIHVRVDSQTSLERLTTTIWQEVQTLQDSQTAILSLAAPLSDRVKPWQIRDRSPFRAAVTSVLEQIHAGAIEKLVLAHGIDVQSSLPFQWAPSLHHLRQLHPDCWVFSVGNGAGQSFIGASPERLLSLQHHHLLTDALAGSAPRGRTVTEDAELAHRLWHSDKERREHQVVVNFIAEQLTQLGLKPKFAEEPCWLKLSNIQHLHTPIRAQVPLLMHPLVLLAKLHPTPAVAGLPRDLACTSIQQYEPLERSLYAAPLGWVDATGNAEFVVGIRSALLQGRQARLFAGAGIVAGSDPDRELAEVRLKLQALLRALV